MEMIASGQTLIFIDFLYRFADSIPIINPTHPSRKLSVFFHCSATQDTRRHAGRLPAIENTIVASHLDQMCLKLEQSSRAFVFVNLCRPIVRCETQEINRNSTGWWFHGKLCSFSLECLSWPLTSQVWDQKCSEQLNQATILSTCVWLGRMNAYERLNGGSNMQKNRIQKTTAFLRNQNGCCQVILVSDPSWKHHPVGRAHWRLLWAVGNGKTLQRQFVGTQRSFGDETMRNKAPENGCTFWILTILLHRYFVDLSRIYVLRYIRCIAFHLFNAFEIGHWQMYTNCYFFRPFGIQIVYLQYHNIRTFHPNCV